MENKKEQSTASSLLRFAGPFSSILLSPFSIDLDLYLNADIIVAKRLDTFCLFVGILKVYFCTA